jgi:glycosyltransferase involved in cell wall biosynthesis
MKLSIVIPIYNEEATLEKIVERVRKTDLGIDKELIIVNDGSKDKSKEIINRLQKNHKNIFAVHHERNKGKGAALRTGFKHVSGDIITVQDGDLEYDPREYKKMIKLIQSGKTNVVYGSRLKGKSEGFTVHSHYYGNKFLSLLTKILYGANITDMETCYKMMTKKVLQGLKLTSNQFDIEPEITAKIIKKGHRILEVPIRYHGRSFKEGKKINWKDGAGAIWALIYWRFKE